MSEIDRILIVDDNESIHEAFRTTLRPPQVDAELEELDALLFGGEATEPSESLTSYELSHAYDGRGGLQAVEQAVGRDEPFAMAIVDVRMPGGWDGIETADQLMKADPELLVVICSGFADRSRSEIVTALKSTTRLKFFLEKPFEFEEVREITAEVVAEWHRARQIEPDEARSAGTEAEALLGDTETVDQDLHEDYFVLLCLEERLKHYELDLANCPLLCKVVHTLEEAALQTIVHAPLAVFCDVITQTRIGFVAMSGLYDLKVCWPVIRCGPRPGSDAPMAMCLDPNRSATLSVAMVELARREPLWRRPSFSRKYKPLAIKRRCEFRPRGESAWRRSTLVSLCADEATLVSFTDLDVGTEIDLKIHGLSEEAVPVSGRLREVRTWSDAHDLPSLDLEIDTGVSQDRLRPELVKPEFVKRLLESR